MRFTANAMQAPELSGEEAEHERIEISLLLEGIYRMYGYDFRNYSYPSIRRRIWHRIYAEELGTVSALQDRVLHNRSCLDRLLNDLVVHVTDMYRDPNMFAVFRRDIVPLLSHYESIRIWHAGCATGEEVYSMAILLHEEGLYNRTRIYATDINEDVLRTAESASYPLYNRETYTRNYMESGGKADFSDYYTAAKDTLLFHSFLKRNIVFARHNLVTDRSFNEFHVVFCRNVLIYFNSFLQDQVQKLIYDSLSPSGILILGNKESLTFSRYEACYEAINQKEKIYRKLG